MTTSVINSGEMEVENLVPSVAKKVEINYTTKLAQTLSDIADHIARDKEAYKLKVGERDDDVLMCSQHIARHLSDVINEYYRDGKNDLPEYYYSSLLTDFPSLMRYDSSEPLSILDISRFHDLCQQVLRDHYKGVVHYTEGWISRSIRGLFH